MNSTNSSSNPFSIGGGGDDDQSTAQTLASGSQDIAALAGLFATDGVETNGLASDTGYGTVISATLSILGILGLVKSSIKLALGPDRCKGSGWTTDSMRGIFGYSEKDSARVTGLSVFDVLHVDVEFDKHFVFLHKKMRKYDTDRNPQINVGCNTYSKKPGASNHGFTLFNAGNLAKDRSILQHPLVVAVAAFVCAGITSWLIAIVHSARNIRYWVFWFGTFGLHTSLVLMIAPTLYHSFLTTRPSQYLTPEIFDVLTRNHDWTTMPKTKRFSFVRRKFPENNAQVLHFRGQAPQFDSPPFTALMFSLSALCVVSYICQYALLKQAKDTEAAVWIAIQAALALIRALYWIADPKFDDPKTNQTELLGFDNQYFEPFSLIRILTSFMDDVGQKPDQERTMRIPTWAFLYLQQTPVGKIIEDCEHHRDASLRRPEHHFSVSTHAHDPLLREDFVPEVSLDKLIRLNLTQMPEFDEYDEKFKDLDMRVVLQPTEPVRPVLLFANDDAQMPAVKGDTVEKCWTHWTREAVVGAHASELKFKWKKRSPHLRHNGHDDFRYIVTWPTDDGGETTTVEPSKLVLDFYDYGRAFGTTDAGRKQRFAKLRIDQTNVPVPRSYALQTWFIGDQWWPPGAHGPKYWLSRCRSSCRGRTPELRRWDIVSQDKEDTYKLAKELIGRDSEINRIWWLDMERIVLPVVKKVLGFVGVRHDRLESGFAGDFLKDEELSVSTDRFNPPEEVIQTEGFERVDESAASPREGKREDRNSVETEIEAVRIGSEKDVDIERGLRSL